MQINSLNAGIAFSGTKNIENVKRPEKKFVIDAVIADNAEITQTKTEPKKIGLLRVLFNRYTKEQIKEINETGEFPKNVKVVDNPATGKPQLSINFFDVTLGTHKMPAGYELRQDLLGFTHLVREDSKAWFLRKK